LNENTGTVAPANVRIARSISGPSPPSTTARWCGAVLGQVGAEA